MTPNVKEQEFQIRLASEDDFEDIFSIWLSGIENSFDTSSVDIPNLKTKFHKNFIKRSGIFNYWVAIDKEQKILGWQSLNKTTVNPLKEDFYAESSTYIHVDARKLGLGDFLIDFVMKEAERSQLLYVTALVTITNAIIRKIAANKGWIEMGEFPPSTKADNKYPKLFIVRPV